MNPDDLHGVLDEVVGAVRAALGGLADWGLAGTRPGQYRSDLAADEAALAVLEAAGLGVLSEESGLHHEERPLLAVIDPVDGSTNAAHGLPWYATSIAVLDEEGLLVSTVVNQASGVAYRATRGKGATRDGLPIAPSAATELGRSLVGLSGYPSRHLGWAQYRTLGAAALDLCSVAEGSLDGYLDCSRRGRHGAWDYLGAQLICQEAGAAVGEVEGRELIVRRHDERRGPVAAATPQLLGELIAARHAALADGAAHRPVGGSR